ncbi:pyridoxal-phosphate dependent enzyme [Belnapia sp. T6]|uniref:Pyridoxal-phosphate dependent enzyme n=1 Tax=Belnapia mucosa TaxID=2804532 RepID=A0ABS1V0U7_9PROT|nr:pyridoxal-phosphate dependent enzyme [Belnapia mucosa]MBL6455325.1 pyridoxal-phosphate dependent enzyme [Belnapia mucosa]
MERFAFHCQGCAAEVPAAQAIGLCGACGGPVMPRYHLRPGELGRAELDRRPPLLLEAWRELLPFAEAGSLAQAGFGELATPLLPAPRLGRRIGLPRLSLKLDLLLPSLSHKDRPHSAVVAAALERGARRIALASSGNGGAALAMHARRAGLEAVVVLGRQGAPSAGKLARLRTLGARLEWVEGGLDAANRHVEAGAAAGAWLPATTWTNPFVVEGEKTIGFEIARQTGWRGPDALILPLGGGAATFAPWKGLAELQALGLLERMPRILGAQFAQCAPVAAAFARGDDRIEPVAPRPSLTSVLMVGNPRLGGPLALRAIRATGGAAFAVPDATVVLALRLLAEEEGIAAEPAGAIALAAAMQAAAEGGLPSEAEVVALICGSASNDPEAVADLVAPA